MNFMGSRGFQPMGGMGMSNGLGMGIGMPSGALSPMAGAGSSMSPQGGMSPQGVMSPQSDLGNMIGNSFGIMPANDSRLPSDTLSRGMPPMQGGHALNPGLPSDQTAKSTSASAPLALKADSLSVAEKAAIADLINGIAKLRDSLGEDPHTPLPLLEKQEAEAAAEQKDRYPKPAEEEQEAKEEPEKAAEVKTEKKEEVREEVPAAEEPAAEEPAAEAPAAEAPAAEAPTVKAPAVKAPAAQPSGGKSKKSKEPAVEAKAAPPAPAAETDPDVEEVQQDASVHGMVSEAKEEFNFTIPADPPTKAAPAAKPAGGGQDKRAPGVPYEKRAAAVQGIIDWAKTDPDFGNIPSLETPAGHLKTLPPVVVAEAAHVQEGKVAFKWQSPVRPMLCAESLFSYPILGLEEDEVVEPLVW